MRKWVVLCVVSACGGQQARTEGSPTQQDAQPPASDAQPPASDVDPVGLALQGVLVIDDFEQVTDPMVAPSISNPPFSGGWYTFDDGSLGQSGPSADPKKETVQDAAVDQPHVTFAMRPPSAHALHMVGGPYTGSWGSGVQGQLQGGSPFDASAYRGIVFWARKSNAAAASSLRVALTTIDDTAGPLAKCHSPATPGKADGCGDAFGAEVMLRTDWMPYIVSFASLAQTGFGYRPPNGFDQANVLAVDFNNKQGTAFDQWIDDLAFYK
jgi:hypothetical protein